ncbi:uncharacterized protein LOC142024643 [Carettochelys insculpta]|uniref:uncharacterized protein LOC142024643 n=1 Tax=Carettochelys insculpta TaxID=44489 RepID=UPI003EC06026
MMEPYSNWEELLKPALLFIASLEQLTSISVGEGNVFVNQNIRELPKSFGACLAQVNIQLWWSFKATQEIMSEMKVCFRGVPKKMAKSVLLCQEGAENAELKGIVKSIQAASNQSRALTPKLRTTFSAVMSLVGNLLQACEDARQGCEQELKRVQELKAGIPAKPAKEDAKQGPKNQQTDEDFRSYVAAVLETGNSVKMVFLQIVKKCLAAPDVTPELPAPESDATLLSHESFSDVREKWEKLQATLEQEQEEFESVDQQNKELMKAECDLKEYEVRAADLETGGRRLGQAVEALKSMRRQWDNMSPFFQMIGKKIDSCFREYLCSVQGSPELPPTRRMDEIFRASSVAQFVLMISDTYVSVSYKHLMPLLGKLKTVSTKSSSENFRLSYKIEETQKEISSLVLQQQEAFKKNVKGQMELVKEAIKTSQQPVDEAKLEAIEGALRKAMRELPIQ